MNTKSLLHLALAELMGERISYRSASMKMNDKRMLVS